MPDDLAPEPETNLERIVTTPFKGLLRSRHLWLLVLSVFCIAGVLKLMPELPIEVEMASIERVSRDLPLPPAQPRESGLNPFDQPFLFEVKGSTKMSASQRERILLEQYREIVSELGSRTPFVKVDTHGTLTVVKIDNEAFVTVLPQDCPEYYQELDLPQQAKLELAIAEQWAILIREDLEEEASMRTPEYLNAYPYLVVLAFFLALIAHILADLFTRKVLDTPGWSLKLLIWLLFFAAVFILHPNLKPLALALGRGALKPVFLGLVIGTLMNVLYHVGVWTLGAYVKAYLRQRGESIRLVQRLKTVEQGLRFLIATLTAVGGTTWFLIAIGLPVDQFLTGAGVAGIVIGVVGRDILLDYFYGFSILSEDKFGIGDWIESGPYSGFVVKFHLRATQIREIDGGLTTVSNGELRTVKNHTRNWAYADFKMRVSYDCEPARALELLGEEVELLKQDWPEKILESPGILAVQALEEDAMVVRAWVKTAPMAQWSVLRELNCRALQRFQREGYRIPFAQRRVWLQEAEEKED